ncbi:YiiD C-terminal domain-containing protein [Halobacteriovorax sp. GB3]|uniref:YiiD C-terminal domain-containing protein n=1 Tax=Halobacteriovorax sp. GB3 TaxID=2719615 RepID=UPI002361C079|nr:YiiD C-terminal domain-containing protein [Halobacteriovorax sp. GB3]MDD0853533.1 YiiD C-terminal domain-containing protein [Halobacteriovorax sp. GB3]
MRLNQIENQIKDKIEMTKNLDFKLLSWQNNELRLSCPLSKNLNHHGSAFGGSLAMAAIVSGYSMTFMALEDGLGKDWGKDYVLVIKDYSCQYLRPVKNDIEARSIAKSSLIQFLSILKRKGKARLEVETFVEKDGEVQLKAQATYVAYKTS